ncbi:LemA family protein [Candidatus Micrarchaeota archaeon]|nr:LemA family protein [Candidatus Micrarchaeota archaeon]
MIWLIIGIIILLLVLFIIGIYNRLIVQRNRVDNAWAQVDVQLKKRYNLVPNLVETVKGYAKHEKSVFTEVTKARASIMKAKTVGEKAKANSMLTNALKSLFAVAENYPNLKASENFKLLQEQLQGIEDKIAYARQFYNDSVLEYNNSLQVFPNNIIAGMFNFKEKEFFEVKEAAARKPVKVKF